MLALAFALGAIVVVALALIALIVTQRALKPRQVTPEDKMPVIKPHGGLHGPYEL